MSRLARRERPWIEGPGPRDGKVWSGTWWIGPSSLVVGRANPADGSGVSVRSVVDLSVTHVRAGVSSDTGLG